MEHEMVVEMNALHHWYVFDRVVRRELHMTAEEFLVYYRSGVYKHADLDYWQWLDTWFVMTGINDPEWEPALKDRKQFMNEVLCDKIGQWHDGAGYDQDLHEYLGWTEEEYAEWVGPRCQLPQRFIDDFMDWNS